MTDILIFASILAPIILALVELVKRTLVVPVNFIPVIALVIGLVVGALASTFTDLDLTMRLWSGALSGLAATGLFELGAKRTGKTDGDWTK